MEERDFLVWLWFPREVVFTDPVFFFFSSKLFVFFCASIKSWLIILKQWKSYDLEQS